MAKIWLFHALLERERERETKKRQREKKKRDREDSVFPDMLALWMCVVFGIAFALAWF